MNDAMHKEWKTKKRAFSSPWSENVPPSPWQTNKQDTITSTWKFIIGQKKNYKMILKKRKNEIKWTEIKAFQ